MDLALVIPLSKYLACLGPESRSIHNWNSKYMVLWLDLMHPLSSRGTLSPTVVGHGPKRVDTQSSCGI